MERLTKLCDHDYKEHLDFNIRQKYAPLLDNHVVKVYTCKICKHNYGKIIKIISDRIIG